MSDALRADYGRRNRPFKHAIRKTMKKFEKNLIFKGFVKVHTSSERMLGRKYYCF